ncbi:DUF456 family protein [Mesosutterella sp. AGMB02718]|uniref:DUF456 family protein n=1 Tax=Mesosutterella faecium TaxID=2925194 RepID=A0ABT7ILL5_9BURK|nr:DUF456 family protein [Mesosutterella sp. AGMB02718]MDL2059263.1 DUF456 family protein [Mesosutterella sp. AGMB02718]
MEYFLYLIALALIAVGMAGTLIPAIPGLPLIFAGGWLIAWASGYTLLGVSSVVILALLAAVGVGIDFLAQFLGAKKAGASRAGLWGAAAGTLLGLFTGVVGIVFFPLIGAVTGEIIAGRDMLKAGTVGIATWIGMAVGIGVKIALAFTMLALILFSSITNSALGHFLKGGSTASSTSAAVPQAPAEAAPLEAYPGKPEPRRAYRQAASGEASSAEASSPAAQGSSPAADEIAVRPAEPQPGAAQPQAPAASAGEAAQGQPAAPAAQAASPAAAP